MKDFTVEINPSHKLIVGINQLRKDDPKLASMGIKQLFDTAMLQSNLPLSTKDYVKRTYAMLDILVNQHQSTISEVHDDVKVERLSTE
jgi:HSP90 family molecular chaperone